MIRKFTILNINYRFLIVFILAFLLLPNTTVSSRTWHNGQTFFDRYALVLSGGLVSPKSGSGSADRNGISIYDSGTPNQSIFTSVEIFGPDTSITITAKCNDSQTVGSHLAFSTNSNNWTTNMALIGDFGEASAATFATESYIVPVKLTGACKYISVPGIGGNSYLNIDALKNNKTK